MMRTIRDIILHCSATAEGKDFTVADIRQWHLARGFKDIGYHYVIYRDGSIHAGRPLSHSGAHCTGHNRHSIGICYVGGCAADSKTPKDTRTSKQKTTLAALLRHLHDRFPLATLHGHCDYARKACPSFDCHKDYDSIFARK